jgi:3D (Asp-Asp-Asp) domain-containing protein
MGLRLIAILLALVSVVGIRGRAASTPMGTPQAPPPERIAAAPGCRTTGGAAPRPEALQAREIGISRPIAATAGRVGYVIPADQPHAPLGRFKLTAYSGPQLGAGPAITATGTAARHDRTVAVDPRVIPLGSRIYIEGIGERVAEDVGGGVKGQHIDVYLDSVPQAWRFGVRRATVSVISYPERRSGKRRRAR